jgi:inner membrane protein
LGSLLLWGGLALLPDADAAGFLFGVRYRDEWGHRGAPHSLVFAAGIGLLVWLVAPRFGVARWNAAASALLVVASHPLLDMLTTGGLGCALLWPFDLQRYFFPWRLIPVAPIGRAFFSTRGLAVALVELLLFLPLFGYALWPRRSERGAAR